MLFIQVAKENFDVAKASNIGKAIAMGCWMLRLGIISVGRV